MKKALFFFLIVLLVSLPAHAKVVSRSVEYKHGDTVLEGYMAHDDSKAGKRPGVLVVHEWWGLNDYVRSRVNKLAQLGYVAFALDMYGKDVWTTDPNKAKELMGHLQGSPLLRERANAGLDLLRKNQLVDTQEDRRHRLLLRRHHRSRARLRGRRRGGSGQLSRRLDGPDTRG